MKLVLQSTRITLVTEDNLKSIQFKILFHTLLSITNSKQSQLLEKLKICIQKTCKRLLLKTVFLNLFKDIVCYQILTNLFIAFNDWSNHLKTEA